MNVIEITNIQNQSPPFDIYVCNVYGNDCYLVGIITANVPPSVEVFLPPQFATAPAVGIKLISSSSNRIV
jgi:hypothetical protein